MKTISFVFLPDPREGGSPKSSKHIEQFNTAELRVWDLGMRCEECHAASERLLLNDEIALVR